MHVSCSTHFQHLRVWACVQARVGARACVHAWACVRVGTCGRVQVNISNLILMTCLSVILTACTWLFGRDLDRLVIAPLSHMHDLIMQAR